MWFVRVGEVDLVVVVVVEPELWPDIPLPMLVLMDVALVVDAAELPPLDPPPLVVITTFEVCDPILPPLLFVVELFDPLLFCEVDLVVEVEVVAPEL